LLKKTVRRLVLLATAPAAMLGLTIVASPASAAQANVHVLMAQLVTKTNQQRARAHCGQVKVNQALVTASVRHSSYMAATGSFSHVGVRGSNFAVRARSAGYTAALSENIGWGYRSSTEMMNAWMNSPGHRANILNCRAKSVGVGVIYAKNGTPYYTQVFGRV
jgi:uncharacterized protein YkwD